MNKLLKYSTALGSATFALAFAVTAASADTGLVNSGNNVNVNTSSNTNSTVNVVNENQAEVNQSSFSIANTGGNATSRNIGGGSVATGKAATSSNQEVTANQNQTAIAMPAAASAGSQDADVVNSGNRLNLNNSTNQTTNAAVVNANNLRSSQQSIGISNTGLNATSRNIDGGSIATGAAGVTSDFNVETNVNETVLDLSNLGGVSGNELILTNTGNRINVNNSTNVSTNVGVLNANSAFVQQNAFGLANSGLNFSSRNIGGGSIATGAAGVSNAFDVMTNKNSTGIAFGASAGASADELDVTNTGNNLNVNGSTNVSTTVSAASSNSSATAQASIDVSNSGLNFGLRNIDGGSLGTGNAGVWSGFMSGGNWNQTLVN